MFNGFGQSDSNWMLRLNSEAKNAFSHIYKTTDLVSSFDGFSLFLCDTQKSTSWLHQDQKSNDTRLSIQGILNILPCDEFDAGFICVPESHIDYIAPPQKNDWVTLPKDDPTNRKPDITLAKQLLDWEPKVSLEEGLMKTIEYLKNN